MQAYASYTLDWLQAIYFLFMFENTPVVGKARIGSLQPRFAYGPSWKDWTLLKFTSRRSSRLTGSPLSINGGSVFFFTECI